MKIAIATTGGVDPSGQDRVIPCLLWLTERLARGRSVFAPGISQRLLQLAQLLAPVLGGPAAPGQTVDEELAILALRRHQVGPLLHGAAMRGGYDIAPGLLAALAESYGASTVRRAQTLARLDRIAGQFAARDIGWMTIKGTIQAGRLYADPAWRDSADIDLLVSPAQFDAAASALDDLGYDLHNPPVPKTGMVRRAILSPLRDISLCARDDHACAVELHRRLFFPDDRRARSIRLQPAPGRIPAPALGPQLALYLILHGANSFWVRLKWLADLAALFSKLDPTEIAAIPDLARQACAENSAAASLILLRTVFPFVRLDPLEAWLARRSGPPVRCRLDHYIGMLNLGRDWRSSPLDNVRMALQSSWLIFEAPATRANIIMLAPISSLSRKLARALWRPQFLPTGWNQPPP